MIKRHRPAIRIDNNLETGPSQGLIESNYTKIRLLTRIQLAETSGANRSAAHPPALPLERVAHHGIERRYYDPAR